MIGVVDGRFLGKNFGESEKVNSYGHVEKSQYMYFMVYCETKSDGVIKGSVDYVYVPTKSWNDFDKVQFGDLIKCEVDVSVVNGHKRLNYITK